MKKLWAILVCLFVVQGSVWASDANVSAIGSSGEPQQMLDFNLAGYGTSGQKTWELEGASMDMEGTDIKISDITAHLFGEKENMVLTADHGRFDKNTSIVYLKDHVRAVTDNGAQLDSDTLNWSQKDKTIKTDDKVNITRGNMTATGLGIEAKPDFKVAKLEKDVVLTIEEDKKAKKKEDKPTFGNGKMVITCDGPMEMNYDKGYAIFEKNVKVEGDADQGVMTTDKMTVYFSATSKQIDKMVASGNVKIVRGENISTSEGAVFTGSDKRLILTGRPKLVLFTEGKTAKEKTSEGKTHVSP